MPSNTASVVIDRPATAVFPHLVDRDARLRWVEGLTSSEPLDGSETRLGSRFRERIEQHGLATTVETTVDELDPPRGLALRVTGKGFSARTRTNLEERDGRTTVRSEIETTVSGLAGRVVGGMVARQAQGSLERSLQALKRLVETRA